MKFLRWHLMMLILSFVAQSDHFPIFWQGVIFIGTLTTFGLCVVVFVRWLWSRRSRAL